MKLLVDSGADIGAKSRCGRSALSYAAEEGALDVVQYLVNEVKVPGVDEGDCDGRTPLSWAVGNAACGKISRILVLSGKADINGRDFSGKPPLFYLVDLILRGNCPLHLDRFFWDRDGVDLDVQDSLGRTLLRYILEKYRLRLSRYSGHTFPRLIMVLLHSEKVDPTKKDLQGVSTGSITPCVFTVKAREIG
jgi:ankyrin repeat protein